MSKRKQSIKLFFTTFICMTFILWFLLLSCGIEEAATLDPGTKEESINIQSREALESEEITLDQMIGQMVIIGFRATRVDASSKIVQDINKYRIGGVILFDYDVPSKSSPRNIVDKKQLETLTKDLQKLTSGDLLIAVDAEGGYVNRLKEDYGFIHVESAQKMGEGEPEETFFKASRLAEQLDSMGINLNFAPVVDVNINKNNPVIGKIERSFSDDPQTVSEHSASFINAMHSYNIISAIKHFPGHGSSDEDSHLGLTDITNTYQREVELTPYRRLIPEGIVDIVMTAHIMNTNIDPQNPATLSSLILEDVLRKDLKFEGVIVSDDMQMGAITSQFGFEDAVTQAINAGCDLLIFSNNGSEYVEDIAQKATETIKKAIDEGKITESRIIESYQRVKELKGKYGL